MPRYQTAEAEAAYDVLDKLSAHLTALLHLADAAHEIISDNGLIPDASGCLPDLLADLIGTVEAHQAALSAEIGLRAAA